MDASKKVKRLPGPCSAREGVGIRWCAVDCAGSGLIAMVIPVPSVPPSSGSGCIRVLAGTLHLFDRFLEQGPKLFKTLLERSKRFPPRVQRARKRMDESPRSLLGCTSSLELLKGTRNGALLDVDEIRSHKGLVANGFSNGSCFEVNPGTLKIVGREAQDRELSPIYLSKQFRGPTLADPYVSVGHPYFKIAEHLGEPASQLPSDLLASLPRPT